MEGWDAWLARIAGVAVVVAAVCIAWTLTFHTDRSSQPVQLVKPTVNVAAPVVSVPAPVIRFTPPPRADNHFTLQWPNALVTAVIVFGVLATTLVIVARQPLIEGLRSLLGQDDAKGAVGVGVTVLAVVAAALPQFNEALGQQKYLVSAISGTLAIIPLIGRLGQNVFWRAAISGGIVALFVAIVVVIFSRHYPLGMPNPITKSPTLVSGWTWLHDQLSSMSPGQLLSVAILALILGMNIAIVIFCGRNPKPAS